jgi:hypothetical protein
MSQISPREGAAALRHAVAALRRRMAVEYGDLVPAASAERTAALAEKLEKLAALAEPGPAGDLAVGIDGADVATLDSWIRAADGFTLHDDAAEVSARAGLGRQLRAIRELLAPHAARLTEDPRNA